MPYPADKTVFERIVDTLATTLDAIAPPNYHHNVRAVHKYRSNPHEDAVRASLPAILIVPPRVDLANQTACSDVWDASFTLRFVDNTSSSFAAKFPYALWDVRQALNASNDLGGLAKNVTVLGAEPFPSDIGDPEGGVDVNILVKFGADSSDPTTPR